MVFLSGSKRVILLNKTFMQLLYNRRVEQIIRCCIGVLFVYASFHKIAEPGHFAKIIDGYQLFPKNLINIMTITIPFIELFSGIALIFGCYLRGATFIINFMLTVFIIILIINFSRDHVFDCGCLAFGGPKGQWVTAQLLLRDIICLAAGIYIFICSYRIDSIGCGLWLSKVISLLKG